MNPNHQVTWLKTRPEFSITYVRGTSTMRGYHESFYEVISEHELDADDWRRLDECGLTGMGQAYHVQKHETFEDVVPPAVVDRRTGVKVECDCQRNNARLDDAGNPAHHETCASIPYGYNGHVFTKTTVYEYHRYDLLRICDSGD